MGRTCKTPHAEARAEFEPVTAANLEEVHKSVKLENMQLMNIQN